MISAIENFTFKIENGREYFPRKNEPLFMKVKITYKKLVRNDKVRKNSLTKNFTKSIIFLSFTFFK